MKNITVFGNLGKDFESRDVGTSTVYKSTIAVYDGRENDENKTQWFDIEFWGKQGETVAGLVGKGSKLLASGELKSREYEGKTYLTVKANCFCLTEKSEPKAKDLGGM
jgi:single-strand DNA-binding protein